MNASASAIASDPRNLRLVVAIAESIHRRLPSVFNIEDLVGEGNLGLCRAASRYNPDAHHGTPFSAFARTLIRGGILESIGDSKWIEATRLSFDDFSKRPTGGPISEYEYNDVRWAKDAEIAFVRAATAPTVERDLDRAERNARVSAAIAWLTAAERELLRVWYGADEPLIWQVARRLRMRVRDAKAMHAQAIAHLQSLVAPGSARERELPKAA